MDAAGYPVPWFKGYAGDGGGFISNPFTRPGTDMAGFSGVSYCERGPIWYLSSYPISCSPQAIAVSPNGRQMVITANTGSTAIALFSNDGGGSWVQAANFPTLLGTHTNQTFSVAAGNEQFVCGGQNDTHGAVSNDGGNTWALWDNGNLAVIGRLWFAGGAFYTFDTSNIMRRQTRVLPVSAAWQAVTLPNGGYTSGQSIASGGGVVMTAGGGSQVVCVSYDDGNTFSLGGSIPASVTPIYGLAYGNGVWVALPRNNTNTTFAYSIDNGTTWSVTNTIGSQNANWNSIIFCQGRFTACTNVGGVSVVYTSSDGKTDWTLANSQLPVIAGVQSTWQLACAFDQYAAVGAVPTIGIGLPLYGTC